MKQVDATRGGLRRILRFLTEARSYQKVSDGLRTFPIDGDC